MYYGHHKHSKPLYTLICGTRKTSPVQQYDDESHKCDDSWRGTTMLVCTLCILKHKETASPFIICLLFNLCLDLGSDLLYVHRRLGWLTFLRRHTLSTALFEMGENNQAAHAAASRHRGPVLQWTTSSTRPQVKWGWRICWCYSHPLSKRLAQTL